MPPRFNYSSGSAGSNEDVTTNAGNAEPKKTSKSPIEFDSDI
jgi:hypothetical protein